MSGETDDLKSIKVYKFSNTKESWFALKFRVIADSRGYEEIIDGTRTPPDEKDVIEILDKDDADTKKLKKEKLAARLANKKGYRDLLMFTEDNRSLGSKHTNSVSLGVENVVTA